MRGLRSQIDETIANVKTAISSRNADATEAVKAVREMSSRAAREKMAEIMGQGKAKVLAEMLDEAAAHLELRLAIAKGSATAPRQAAVASIKASAAPGALRELLDANPGTAMKNVFRAITGSTAEAKAARETSLFVEIAQALTAKRGPDAEAALATIKAAMQGQPISTAQAYKIARTLTTGGALAAYQTGTQLLPSKQRAQ